MQTMPRLYRQFAVLCAVSWAAIPVSAQLSAISGSVSTITRVQTPVSISSPCAELPFDSFPPNQLLRSENSDGSAVSVLQSGKAGPWAEFFIQVDQAGSYRVKPGFLKGPRKGIFQLIVNGDPVGDPIDSYSAGSESPAEAVPGNVTFQKAGIYSFRFLVTGKNQSSSGFSLSLQNIALTPVEGFTLASPNGSCEENLYTLLRWNSWTAAKQYRVELDGQAVSTLDAPATTYRATQLAQGAHRWRVVGIEADRKQKPSNVFSFVVGNPSLYPCREFSETFSSGILNNWSLESIKLIKGSSGDCLQATGADELVDGDYDVAGGAEFL